MPEYDLLIRGGDVIDPASGLHERLDLAVNDGRIAALSDAIDAASARKTLDASGSLVVPGLIDLHAHLGFALHGVVVEADDVCPPSGVTTAVDMGTVGAFTMPWYVERTLSRTSTRLLSFINIASIGLIGGHTDCYTERYGKHLDVQDTIRTIETYRDHIRGIKTFGASALTGQWPIAGLKAAREVADAVDLPICVHVSGDEPPLDQVLSFLHEGDIMTHTFTPHAQRILDGRGRILDAVRDARARGVLFDVGHGAGSFSFDIARRALDQGFVPDTISTDLYFKNVDHPVKDLQTTLAKFLALGLSLEDVLVRATVHPADAISEPALGRLNVGGTADVAVIRVKEGRWTFTDVLEQTLEGGQRIVCQATIRQGELTWEKGA